MSEKQRFEYNYKTGRICDNESNSQCTSNMMHIVRRLNDFNEQCKKLKGENEQLKSKLEESKKAHSNCDKLWWELHDEKEQLKKENKQLKQEIQQLKSVSTK